MKNVLQEFRKFAVRGNVVDMAVGIIVGAAFTKIVSSAVADVITPPLGLVIGGVDFSKLVITLRAATDNHPAVVLAYGKFIQALIDFTIIAFVIFMLVKLINRLKHHHEQQKAAAAPPKDEVLLGEIRDLLQSRLPPAPAAAPGPAGPGAGPSAGGTGPA